MSAAEDATSNIELVLGVVKRCPADLPDAVAALADRFDRIASEMLECAVQYRMLDDLAEAAEQSIEPANVDELGDMFRVRIGWRRLDALGDILEGGDVSELRRANLDQMREALEGRSYSPEVGS